MNTCLLLELGVIPSLGGLTLEQLLLASIEILFPDEFAIPEARVWQWNTVHHATIVLGGP